VHDRKVLQSDVRARIVDALMRIFT
jgi:hypothetical protein